MNTACDRCNKPVDMASKDEDDRAAMLPGLFFGHNLCFGITMGIWVLTQDDRTWAFKVAELARKVV
jgi:hypothetical protein